MLLPSSFWFGIKRRGSKTSRLSARARSAFLLPSRKNLAEARVALSPPLSSSSPPARNGVSACEPPPVPQPRHQRQRARINRPRSIRPARPARNPKVRGRRRPWGTSHQQVSRVRTLISSCHGGTQVTDRRETLRDAEVQREAAATGDVAERDPAPTFRVKLGLGADMLA